jgi:hypothetical protein
LHISIAREVPFANRLERKGKAGTTGLCDKTRMGRLLHNCRLADAFLLERCNADLSDMELLAAVEEALKKMVTNEP